MEKRKESIGRSSPLPSDYLKMVKEVFETNFETGLQALSRLTGNEAWFQASGEVYLEEIVLAISLFQKDRLAATTIYASCDFDPKANSPTLEDLLSHCVDAIGGLLGQLLDSTQTEKLEAIADDSLSALEDVPFQWTSVDVNKRRVFIKIDKTNPDLEKAADEWLRKNDPQYRAREKLEEKETEDLFFTGPRTEKPDGEIN